MTGDRPLLILLSLACCLLNPAGAQESESWKESGFEAFADGTFSDGGANTYVSASGRLQLVNRWDVNGDGFIDLLCPNSHPLLEMLDMSIYWGNGRDFSIRRHSYVPADGPMWVAPGDLDLDGSIDLVVANYSNGTWTSMDSAIYWGGERDPSAMDVADWVSPPFRGKSMLPTKNAQGVIQADLNRDGYPEIVFAMSAGFWEYRGTGPVPGSRIYWNRQGRFARDDFTPFDTQGATDVAAADINGDGWPDLAFSNGLGIESYIYFGGADGFSEQRRVGLLTAGAQATCLADIDGDGDVDVLFANESGPVSTAYLNVSGDFSPDHRVDFQTHYAKDVVVADFNRDGAADVFFTNHLFAEEGKERFGTRMTTSFLYFGGADGFDPVRRQELQTIGAWGASAADLNEDGWVDLLVCNFQEHYSFEVPSFIYWNGPDGFQTNLRTPLYEHGAQGNAIADFDGDGHPDVLITSMMGRSRGDYDPSYLYFGNARGEYSTTDRILLPGREPYEQAMADIDDDGRVDIVLLNQGEVTRYENEAFIYWNQENQFDPWRVSGLPAHAGVGVEIADLDRDGYLDVIIANNKPYASSRDEDGRETPSLGSFIYWGAPGGFVVTDRLELPIWQCRSPSIADLNGDGHLDLVFAGEGASIFWGDGSRRYGNERRQFLEGTLGTANHQTEVADLNRDGFLDIIFAGSKVLIYHGDAGSVYSQDDHVELAIDSKTMTVADVDQDGWLDLVCPLYKQGGSRSLDSSVLLGGPTGFDLNRRITLPTDGATGSLVSDFNSDGYQDIFFFCHRTDGDANTPGQYADHQTDSRLYWGSAEGFSAGKYLRIPTVGVHYDMGMDIGRINDRRFQWEYTSSAYEAGDAVWKRLLWEAETPGQTRIRFQVRSAPTAEALAAAEWRGPDGPDSFYDRTGAELPAPDAGRWIQYRVILDTANGAASPVLTSVEVEFR
ncbi:MAG: VCBS repeat-containing protein [Opitutaceae bacterium]